MQANNKTKLIIVTTIDIFRCYLRILPLTLHVLSNFFKYNNTIHISLHII